MWYVQPVRERVYSLKTKDRKKAFEMAAIIQNEIDKIHIYKIILKEHQNLLKSIEYSNTRIYRELLKSDMFEIGNGRKNKKFESEEEMQTKLIPVLENDFKFKKLEQFKNCKSGIADGYGVWGDQKVIIEFKIGSIDESHLGQCLRYLNDESIPADSLWLIGEGVKKTATIFKQFKKIKVFSITKSNRSAKMLKPVYNIMQANIDKILSGM